MKKLLVLMLAVSSLLSGCYVYDGPNRNGGVHRGDRDGASHRDHDRDGVQDRDDRRPNNPNRY
ncbi:MAG: hypothetical protein IPJ12_14195 [Betaproteobacteria bacterium]|nr:hypothetical protein [Betaproteobacteria bacterium]